MQKESLLAKKIIGDVKKYSPLHKIAVIEIELPNKYGFNKSNLISIFKSIGIELKVLEGKKLKLIALQEKY